MTLSKTVLKRQNRYWEISGVIFDIENREKTITDLEEKVNDPNLWDNPDQAQTLLKKLSNEKEIVKEWNHYKKELDDLLVLLELSNEDDSSDIIKEIDRESEKLLQKIKGLEMRGIMSEPEDSKNAILTIHPGAGGTESQDWAEMLMRMYLRWADQNGFKNEVLDLLPGEEAGIKSVTIEITGAFAYGYLKAENGVHRLVRISPFDASGRRHTSFASVFVVPEVDEEIEIEINPNDLRIDTYRASGAGGQHVNRTDSAVRITHIPTNIVVTCQNERSQHKNKANALKILKARLYQKKLEEEQVKKQKLEDSKTGISWGNQIRSYVFHPYNMVKDHRTDFETSDIQSVMDGDIDGFIHEFLLNRIKDEK
ncbi:MAG: peptide chain release factor 2 [Calditrichaeota bacterium]|nr:peptide chain release factor 2 [Calditrichota bacterium]